MIRAVWKMVSLFLALAGFLTLGVMSLMAGEDLIWAVGKAIGAFIISWIVLGFFGNALFVVLEKQDLSKD